MKIWLFIIQSQKLEDSDKLKRADIVGVNLELDGYKKRRLIQ
jgi:hypothetical protein